MARHRSPRGRGAHQNPPLVALGRTVASEVARHSAPLPAPLRRGAAAAVVTGGALSLVGVTATLPIQINPAQVDPGLVAAAAVVPAVGTAASEAGSATAAEPPASLAPVAGDAGEADTERLDTAKLVKAVQLAERDTTRGADDQSDEADEPDERADSAGDAEQPADAAAGGRGDDDRPEDGQRPAGDAERDRPKAGSTGCDLDSSQLGAVKQHVRTAANFLGCQYGEPTVLGVAGRAGNSDHPSGKALDFMVQRATGNALAACALRNQEALGISYLIWRQRINFGEGWQPMEDRGSPTANHMDHVHVSFESGAGGRPNGC